ncbi:PREDICTED: ribosomal RNA small subunit methyltransferase, mitochondrial isoform X2 [Nelumbo nucifera]|uniref:rRNA adenine N(6)-methyltransferase n=1 Tax=Nelumbo nucifera TaxID=4432 RepID=A0A1U8B9F2_NELNU|nr:PREDICTED: ribosomal RNA small subunit methyltransferase, mitochondrial isoform X2 [Nelumbo nucifera]
MRLRRAFILEKCLSTSLTVTGFLSRKHCLRLLGTMPSRYYVHRDDNDEDERKRKREGQEGYIYFHKSRGQHILTNPRVLDSIVRRAEIRPTDTVLEIGPGTGNLTLKLLEVAEKVFAVEIDKRMVEVLNNRVAECGLEDRLTVICKDALKMDFPPFDLIVANIPYGISSPLIAKLVFGAYPFRSATLLLQKEFARRLLANPGDSAFNRLAVNVKLVAEVEFVMDVSKKDFIPCPKVDSSVVKIWPKTKVPDVDMHEWWAFTRTCFNKKNKTLGATFKQKKKVVELLRRSQMMDSLKDHVATRYNYDDYDDKEEQEEQSDGEHCFPSPCSEKDLVSFKEMIAEVLKAGGFEAKRPSKLSIEELLHLLSLLNQAGIYFNDRTKGKDVSNEGFVASYSS